MTTGAFDFYNKQNHTLKIDEVVESHPANSAKGTRPLVCLEESFQITCTVDDTEY